MNEVIKNKQNIIEFVNQIELPELPKKLLNLVATKLIVTDEDKAAYVSAGSIFSFVAGLKSQQKEDVLNSTLLAQLAANKAFDREKDTENWYKKYREVLEKVGWVISDFDFTKYKAEGTTFEISKVMLDILAAIASENAMLVTKSAIDAVKALDNGSKAFTIWDSTTHSSTNGNFAIAPCVNDDGNVVMGIGCSYFSTQTINSNFLWFSYSSSSVDLYKGTQTVVLNEDVYSSVRKVVIEKLGDNAVNYIADLDI